MAIVVVNANLKGGVTKTTTSLNVATAASLLGKRVLVVDDDLQGNITSAFGYAAEALEHTTYTLILGESRIGDVLKKTCFDKVSKRFIDPNNSELLERRKIKSENMVAGPDLLPCNTRAAEAENDLIRNPTWGPLLRNALEEVRAQYDYIFIDTHPDLGKMTINGFIAADYVVIPTVPEPWPTNGFMALSRSIVEAQKVNRSLQVGGILFARIRYSEHTKLMEYIRETLVPNINQQYPTLHLSCFQTFVQESAAFSASTSRQSCVVLSHPVEAVSLSYWAHFAEFLQRIEHPDFPQFYQQFQRLLGAHKAKEQEKLEAKQANVTRGETHA